MNTLPEFVTTHVTFTLRIVSVAVLRYAPRLSIVLTPAGTVMTAGGDETELVEVTGADIDELDGPTTVTRTSIG